MGEAGVVAIFCGKLLAGERATVFGDGEQTRDYVFVDDVVAANLAAVDHPEATGAFNIGTGVQASVNDLVRALGELSDDGFEVDYAPARKGEVQHIALDFARAREELGWEPKVDLREGLRRTLDSLR
jgi:UDP-glucose 4-epimerase